MGNNLNPKTIFNGTDGAVWLQTDTQEVKIGSMQSATLKQTNQWEDVDVSESLTKKRKLVGIELTGEIVKFKVDNTFINIFQQYKDGDIPDISLIMKAYNNNTGKMQRVKVVGVTLDENILIDLQQKKAIQESIPYAAENYEWLENV